MIAWGGLQTDSGTYTWTGGRYRPLGGGIPCEDLVSFQARCQSDGSRHRLQAKLTLTDTSHSGEQVTITVDGNPNSVTIKGDRAQLVINNPALGGHTIELTDPAGCFPPVVATCD